MTVIASQVGAEVWVIVSTSTGVAPPFQDDGEVFYLRWEDQSDTPTFEERTYTVNAEETIYRLPEDGPDYPTPYSKAQPRRRRIV